MIYIATYMAVRLQIITQYIVTIVLKFFKSI